MINFPSKLNVQNKNNFKKLHYERTLCYFRRELYEHIIKNEESVYFELDLFFNKHMKNETEQIQIMVETVIKELNELGWKCKTSFGNTALFIYSTENPPFTCYEDGF